ncbi:mitochondrial import inner membrane translocase subunit Tim54 [Limtongia smithiae]|uniref:mitochondrial import inner membrane translocase subunit Tim54 n=1 Tax=Limtongia smithiae TaxID=1125753 RepID=UPI0034CFDCB2
MAQPGAAPAAGEAAPSHPSPPKVERPHNPVLKALGIPRIRMPGPKMSLFLGTVLGIAGFVYNDRTQRRANREKWKAAVASLALEPLPATAMPRKVTVYMSPPPGDHLDVTREHFAQYVKPILTAAAVDYEVVEETKQGQIRSAVAERVRDERRGVRDHRPEYIREMTKGLTFDNAGGAVCVGRGAYKEYLHGLNEGWLGPLEAPVEAVKEEPTLGVGIVESSDAAVQLANDATKAAETGTSTDATPPGTETAQMDGAAAEEKKVETVVKPPYITTTDYDKAPTPPGLLTASFEPIMYVPHPHILGFMNTPLRLYRYFHQHELADRVGRVAAAVALNNSRPFVLTRDSEAGLEEEAEWPPKWVETGREKGSEWVQELVVDDRIADRLRVYELPEVVEQE